MLRKIPLAGGRSQVLAPALNLASATWTTNDTVIYGPAWRNPLFGVSADGGEPRPLTILDAQQNEVEHVSPHVLPTGTHLLMTVGYAAKEVGREEEVYVEPYAGPGARMVISRGGGIEPVWSPTGREIFYRSVDGRRMMGVNVQAKPALSVGTPRVLFEGPFPLGTSYFSDYDVFPDGTEFLMIAADDVGTDELHVAVNWTAEVRRRFGTPD